MPFSRRTPIGVRHTVSPHGKSKIPTARPLETGGLPSVGGLLCATGVAVFGRVEGGLIECKAHHHRDGHHVRLVLHYDPLHTPNDICIHICNPTDPIHDYDV